MEWNVFCWLKMFHIFFKIIEMIFVRICDDYLQMHIGKQLKRQEISFFRQYLISMKVDVNQWVLN